MPDLDTPEHSYPTSFIPNNVKIATQLRALQNETLFTNSVHKFHVSISRGQRTKTGLTKLTMDHCGRRTNELVRLSTEELHELV